jgi:phospholipid/cholesterol/gamma-HCH transport system substrate-binding protein
MDLHYRQELQVGFLVLAALAVVIGGLLWLSGRSLAGSEFDVRFSSIQGVTVGDPVQISGVRVGRVSDLQLRGVGEVILTLEVHPSVEPRADASAGVRSLDFLGAKYIEYDPGTVDDPLPSGTMVTGRGESDIAATAVDLADDASALLKASRGFFSEDMADQLRRTMVAAERGLDVMGQLGEGPMISDATTAITTLQSAVSRLDSLLANPAIGESVSQLDEITEGMREMTQGLGLVATSLASMLDKIDTSEGTVGLLLNDRTLHDDLSDVLQSMRALMDDIRENPGRYGPRSIKLF